MKTIWVRVIPWNKDVVTTALESGVDALLIPDGYVQSVRELGIIKTISNDGDLKLGEEVIEFEINNKQDEEEAVRLAKTKTLIIKTTDWTIIPLENLIAQTQGLIARVTNEVEARVAIGILEKGVSGILLDTQDMNEIKRCANLIKSMSSPSLSLAKARITRVEPLGMGDRVCIDTCTNMKQGEGMLVGNSSGAMFLVHSESIENPYVAQRPFRVNAGGVHAYTLVPGNKTRYLSELKTGDETLIVNHHGQTQAAIVGRVKIEKRPLMLIEGSIDGKNISLILQNAETIRLCQPDGSPVSVVSLKDGDEVLAYQEETGRHFGMKIDESIVEK